LNVIFKITANVSRPGDRAGFLTKITIAKPYFKCTQFVLQSGMPSTAPLRC
jgi:hypothetical protein